MRYRADRLNTGFGGVDATTQRNAPIGNGAAKRDALVRQIAAMRDGNGLAVGFEKAEQRVREMLGEA